MCPFCNTKRLLTANDRCKLTSNTISIEQRDDVCTKGTGYQECAYYLEHESPKPKDPLVSPRIQLAQIYSDIRPSVREKLDNAFGDRDGFISAMIERYNEYAPNVASGLAKTPLDISDPIVAVSIESGVIFDYFADFVHFPWGGNYPRNGSLAEIISAEKVPVIHKTYKTRKAV